MSRPATKPVEVRVPGPLAPFAAGFKASLLDTGYTPLTAVVQLRLMVHLSKWLAANDMAAKDLTAARVSEYLSLRAAGYTGLFTNVGWPHCSISSLCREYCLQSRLRRRPRLSRSCWRRLRSTC